ncbi:demethylmenaquinone methyltransferase [Companilactobacillus allii]|uniref:Demethylmenaquinone methyltransferase n=1 Tax=Companilactobacillus allii TaxID=1847728 RepID=A0A1P8Q0L4_9LACO|nr:demethylmenaquinone methyltransferase [Companilactobacillus allii]APX71376.1 bifunctional demethylmenaquinone methyltransferase/2-methoxy-6-polyprenyl-1,4-benzoquinol methylase [Companilactobacillus allii]USQ68456.1 demethylmenaquinone methyltransferase [Companilactobacillus allii]
MTLTNKVSENDVKKTFNTIATDYDKMNSIMSLGTHKKWRVKATSMITNHPKRILDLCCGTADWTILLGKQFPLARVSGMDFSQEMLKIGQSKVGQSGLENVELLAGDAMDLTFRDESFDVVTIGFGLRNVPDANKVLQEIYRVLKPGGQVVCLEAFKVQTPVIKVGWKLYFNKLMPMMGKVFASKKDEYQYLDDSVNKFVSISQLVEMYQNAGFEDIKTKELMMKSAAIHVGTKKI